MTVVQYSVFDDAPVVEITAKGKAIAAKLPLPAQASPATERPASLTTAPPSEHHVVVRAPPQAPTPNAVRPAAHHVPLSPHAQIAEQRLAALQPAVRIALLECLAVAATHEAATQRAVLPTNPVYPYVVNVHAELLAAGVNSILQSPAFLQALALNVVLADIPDEPVPEPSPEYVAYCAAEEARTERLSQSRTTTNPSRAAGTSSQQLADQFGVPGSDLVWPSTILNYTKTLKDGQTRPIVPLVLLVGSRTLPYKLPKLAMASPLYATSQQVRVRFFDESRTERGIMQDACYPIPSAQMLMQIVERYTTFQQTLGDLERVLRDIGTYAQRLRETCGIADTTTAPTAAQLAKFAKQHGGVERLCDTVITAPEPEKTIVAYNEPFQVPAIGRSPIYRHTPVCYQKDQHSTAVGQGNTFPCPDEHTWTRVQAALTAARAAQQAWLMQLADLHTYKTASAQHRDQPVDAPLPVQALSFFDDPAPASTIPVLDQHPPHGTWEELAGNEDHEQREERR